MVLVNFLKIALMLLEILSCIAGFIAMPSLKNSFWRWFPFYLIVLVVGELLGHYLAFVPGLNKYNPMLFNFILCPLQIIFFNWLLYKNVDKYNKKKAAWVLYGIVIYSICLVIDWIFIPDTSLWVSTFSYSVGMLTILFAIMVFFYYYINSEDIIVFKKDMAFWVCLGLFLYYVATLPFEGLRNTLLQQPHLFMQLWYIYMLLACFTYVSFIISFVWARPR